MQQTAVLSVWLGFKSASYELYGRGVLEKWDCGVLFIANPIHFVLCLL